MMAGTLLIGWLLKGILCSRMSGDVLIITTMGSAFALLDSLKQLEQRGSSLSCCVKGRGM